MNKTCWDCKHLTSEVGALPPVLCAAYPDGISMAILSGETPHDHLFGDEKEKVFFEPKSVTETKVGDKGLRMASGEIRQFASKRKRDNFERMAQAVKHGFKPSLQQKVARIRGGK